MDQCLRCYKVNYTTKRQRFCLCIQDLFSHFYSKNSMPAFHPYKEKSKTES